MRRSILLILPLMLSCCTNNISVNTEILSEDILNQSQECVIDTLDVNDSLYLGARSFFVYKDSILIVLRNNPQNDSYIEFRNLKSQDLIAKYFNHGNGRGELLSANVDMNDNLLFVNDFVKSQFAFVDIDSVITNPNYSPVISKNVVASTPTVVPFKDGFIVENPYCFSDESLNINQGIEDGIQRFIQIEPDAKEFELPTQEYEYYTRAVAVDGRIIRNNKTEQIVYAYFGPSVIEFYDSDLNIQKRIEGPKKMDIKYRTFSVTGMQQPMVVYKEKVPYSYLGYCCDERYVYLMYIGDFYKDDSDLMKMKTYILKFDWNGTFKKSYRVGMYLCSISKGNDEDTFYATGFTKNGEHVLLKLN